MKKTFFTICFAAILLISPSSTFAKTEPPTIQAETAILIDADTGEILYEKDSHKRMYPASITKLMTVLLGLEHLNIQDKITFSHNAVYSIEPGSANIAIQEGEILTLEQCIYAIILRSANEVSNAIAEAVDGTTEAFAEHMTTRAKEIGCKDTNFVNAHGLFDENHYTTAYDMALIAKTLYQNETYRTFLNTTSFEIPPTNVQSEARPLHNQHQMLNKPSLYYYEYAIGGKTGYTNEALNTLVTYAQKDGTTLIAVVLKCNGAEHYLDSAALFDYGFENFKTTKILSANDYVQQVNVVETYKKDVHTLATIQVAPQEDIYKTLDANVDTSRLKTSVVCPVEITPPVEIGQKIGELQISYLDTVIENVDLVAKESVAATPLEVYESQEAEAFKSKVIKIVRIPLFILLGFCVLLTITRSIGHYQRKQRRKKRRRQQRRRQSQHNRIK